MAGARKPVVEVRRSQRRRRTVSAYRDGERVVVLIPDQFSRAEESEWVDRMLARLAAREGAPARSDASCWPAPPADRPLPRRVRQTGAAGQRPVGDQPERPWGSCTPADRTIRISHRHPGHARLGDRLRAAARAGAPHRAQPQRPVLGAGRPLPEGGTRPRLPGGRRRGRRDRPDAASSATRPARRRVGGWPDVWWWRCSTPVPWTPPGIDPADWRAALAEDVVDLLATLNEVDAAVAAHPGRPVAGRGRRLARHARSTRCPRPGSARCSPPPSPTGTTRRRSSPATRRTCPGCCSASCCAR